MVYTAPMGLALSKAEYTVKLKQTSENYNTYSLKNELSKRAFI
jgi:hypothetical protein